MAATIFIPDFIPPENARKKVSANPSKIAGNSPQNALRGSRNRQEGAEFEERVDAACEYYNEIKAAVIEKTPEPMRVIRSLGEGRFEACFSKKAQPDYKGSIKNGKTVVFEAKHTSTDRMFASVVKNTQWKALEAYYAIGAVCFVVVGFGARNSYRIPWRIWREMDKHFGRKYITEADIQGYKLSYVEGILMFLGDTHGTK